jgi:hypothetical protein
MARPIAMLLAVGAAAALAGPARGQGFPFQESRLNGAAILLRHSGVQTELRITEQQNDKVREVSQKVRDRYQDEFAKMERMENGRERSLFKRNLSQQVISEVTKELPKILSPEQYKRLQQISLQHGGVQAFDEGLVKERLKLSKEQEAQIDKVREAAKPEFFAIRQADLTIEQAKQKEQALQNATVEKAVAVLTPDQKKVWQELRGAPFDFDRGGNKPTPTEGRTASPAKGTAAAPPAGDELARVEKRVQDLQPTHEERRFDDIGWAKGILHGLALARESKRPVIVHTYNDGRIGEGRC